MRKGGKRARWIFGGIAIAAAVCLLMAAHRIGQFHHMLIRTAEEYASEKFSFPVYQTGLRYNIITDFYYVTFTTDDQPYPIQFEVGVRNGGVERSSYPNGAVVISDYYSNVADRILANDLYANSPLTGRFDFLVIVENVGMSNLSPQRELSEPEEMQSFPEGDLRGLTAEEVLDWKRWDQRIHISIAETLPEETVRALMQELWDDLEQKHYRCRNLWITCETEGYKERQIYSRIFSDSEISRKDNDGWYDEPFQEEAKYLAQLSGDRACAAGETAQN